MKLTEERVVKWRKAFGITTLALGLVNAYGGKSKQNDKLLEYTKAISGALHESPIDKKYLELLMEGYADYMENYIKELINKQRDEPQIIL